MKREILPSILLTLVCILFFAGFYPMAVWLVAQAAPNKGKGFTIAANDKTYYQNIGQKFTQDQYFWSRPSAVAYNAAASGGSNKGPSNPDYLSTVQARIDSFLAHNPGISKEEIPSDLVTASGSGLDPDISVAAALVQVPRIARIRHMREDSLRELVTKSGQKSWSNILGPDKINVLQLNLALDRIASGK
jgi:K+-transporting ATPase ATPase C chain